MKVTFCGNRLASHEEVEASLKRIIEALIKEGADEFLLGGYGNFDKIAASVVKSFKVNYPQIKSILVIPYLNRDYNKELYDLSVYPELENVHPKGAIVKRNQYMIDEADVVVACVKYKNGGAHTTLKYAEKKNKRIIDVMNIP